MIEHKTVSRVCVCEVLEDLVEDARVLPAVCIVQLSTPGLEDAGRYGKCAGHVLILVILEVHPDGHKLESFDAAYECCGGGDVAQDAEGVVGCDMASEGEEAASEDLKCVGGEFGVGQSERE